MCKKGWAVDDANNMIYILMGCATKKIHIIIYYIYGGRGNGIGSWKKLLKIER